MLVSSTEAVIDEIAPEVVWQIVEMFATIICACLIVSKPWLVKVYPERLVTWIRQSVSSSTKSSDSSQVQKPRFSSFGRFGSKPPAITRMSLGASFERGIKKEIELETHCYYA